MSNAVGATPEESELRKFGRAAIAVSGLLGVLFYAIGWAHVSYVLGKRGVQPEQVGYDFFKLATRSALSTLLFGGFVAVVASVLAWWRTRRSITSVFAFGTVLLFSSGLFNTSIFNLAERLGSASLILAGVILGITVAQAAPTTKQAMGRRMLTANLVVAWGILDIYFYSNHVLRHILLSQIELLVHCLFSLWLLVKREASLRLSLLGASVAYVTHAFVSERIPEWLSDYAIMPTLGLIFLATSPIVWLLIRPTEGRLRPQREWGKEAIVSLGLAIAGYALFIGGVTIDRGNDGWSLASTEAGANGRSGPAHRFGKKVGESLNSIFRLGVVGSVMGVDELRDRCVAWLGTADGLAGFLVLDPDPNAGAVVFVPTDVLRFTTAYKLTGTSCEPSLTKPTAPI